MTHYDNTLTSEQMNEVGRERVPADKAQVSRFYVKGQALDIWKGDLDPPNTPIEHQKSYWNFTRETALKIAGWLDVEVRFSP